MSDLTQKINEDQYEEVEKDISEVEGITDHIPRPSDDGDADMDLDERGGDQQNHETR